MRAMAFAQAGGLDLNKTVAAVTGGAAGSWMLSNRGPQVVERDWRPGFTIDLQQRDLRLVLEAADQLGVPLLGTSAVFQMYRSLQQLGWKLRSFWTNLPGHQYRRLPLRHPDPHYASPTVDH